MNDYFVRNRAVSPDRNVYRQDYLDGFLYKADENWYILGKRIKGREGVFSEKLELSH